MRKGWHFLIPRPSALQQGNFLPILPASWWPGSRVEFARSKHPLQVFPAGVNQLRVPYDLVYHLLRAVAPHVGLPQHVVEVGLLVEAMNDVAERSEEHTSELQSPDHLVC